MLGTGSGRHGRHRVVASVKHEMQGALVGLHVLLDALEDDTTPSELRWRMRAHTRVLTRRLGLLSQDLHLVSELDPHTPRLVHEDVDLETMVAESAALFPGLEVHLQCTPDLHVRADVRRLRQVLGNLMSNAQRRGSRPLHLYAADEGRTMRLRVRDPGPRDGHQMFIVDLLVRAHGGRTSHDEISESLILSLPRASSTVRPRPGLLPSA